MRSTTAGELAVLAANDRVVTFRVKVANGSGTMIDITSWLARVSWDEDIDQPVNAASLDLIRADGTTQSFAPLRTDSTLNRLDDGVTYSPLIYPGRKITIEVATTATGAAVVSGDYKLMFEGTVEGIAWESSPISVRCRDRGGRLVDRWVQYAVVEGSPSGTAMETVIQTVYDSWVGSGSLVPFPETIYVPVSPSELITEYLQQPMRVIDALQTLARVKGWEIRYKWDDGTSAFRLTLYEPDRAKTTPDYTFGPSAYLGITALDLDRLSVRNWIEVQYPDAGPPKSRGGVTVSDSTSITDFDLQYQLISEGDYSPINTSAQATTMANAILSDLKEPKADHELETFFFWPAELGDLYRHSANSVHYNSNQDFAVVRIEHTLSPTQHRTKLKTRGTVAGGHKKWLQPPPPTPLPIRTSIIDPTTGDTILDPATGDGTLRDIVIRKFGGLGGSPAISVPTGGGAMGTSPTGTITGTDTAGFIHTVVGTSPAASGNICTVTFATAYATAPFVVISGGSSGGMNANAYATSVSTTSFTITTSAGYGGAGAILDFYYQVIA